MEMPGCAEVTTERTPVISEESGRKGNEPGEETGSVSVFKKQKRL